MQQFPHRYHVKSSGTSEGGLATTSENLPDLVIAPPAEFDGPGDAWSPETLFAAAVSSCFILSFRAVAAASRYTWKDIECESEVVLDRVDKVTRFTRVQTKVRLTVDEESDKDRGTRLLEKAESVCLVTNSLSAELELDCEVVT
jgi:peroxiredoxin-like protein